MTVIPIVITAPGSHEKIAKGNRILGITGNYTRILRAILNKSWRHHPTRHQLYGHMPPMMKTIQIRQTRHAGHCWRSRDELISDVLLWTPTYGREKTGRPARTYIQQLCEDMGCSPEDLPKAMNDGEKWRARVRDIHARGTTWWWLYVYTNVCVCVCVCARLVCTSTYFKLRTRISVTHTHTHTHTSIYIYIYIYIYNAIARKYV